MPGAWEIMVLVPHVTAQEFKLGDGKRGYTTKHALALHLSNIYHQFIM
jgi:hypothetical protein